ncbi:MAG: phosphotransferase [Kordiimonadaceae bacterium]|jgi:Ser/Thr protein kinase RdoA (MazF antagonist)|nr:phosphotransferase [Kordiimonadaceae bacterium]MBT6033165.1 phosphotransferase [Kordiimonadaceae bacterium]
MNSLPEIVPNFDNEKIAKIVKDLYGLEGEISSFVSYEDQNALIKTKNGKFVFKIANTKWPKDFVQAQIDVLKHLKVTAPKLKFSETVKTLKGDELTKIDGFYVRLLTFLEGEMLTNMPRNEALYSDVGRFLGQFSKALENFSPKSPEGSDPLWKLDQVIDCKPYVKYVIDDDTRDRMMRLYDVYEKDILPKLPLLRKAIIHSDANEQNFLISPDAPTKISGLIDFGELQYASQINELAITLAYGLLGENDVEMASNAVINAYDNEFKILDEEREILFYLMAMRLITTITMSSYNANLYPENEYILIAQAPALILLKQLEDEKYILN